MTILRPVASTCINNYNNIETEARL